MKRNLAALLTCMVFALVIIVTQFSCKHEVQITCAQIGFKLTAVKSDAVSGASNGSISISSTGGNGFKYSLNGGAFQDTGYFGNLAPFAQYRILGKNSAGCTDTALINIGSIDPCSGVTINLATSKVDASPNKSDGSITVTATGGSGFSYSLNGGTMQTSGNFSGLAAGTYTIAAKSAAGCTGTIQVNIATNDPCAGITVAITNTLQQPTTGQSNGSITATATGGSGFTYSINGGAYQASGTFGGLAAGNYTIAAKNANGCTGSTVVALGASNPCSGITVVVTSTSVNPTSGQSNGSITASASGGTGFTYSLNNGTYQATGNFTGLAAGAYTITAKNSNGCLGTQLVTLTATSICSGVNITITPTIVNATPCISPANGSIGVTAAGSTGFMYNIGGGTYQAGNSFPNLAAGSYLMGVKDGNGCTSSQTVTVGVVPAGPTFALVRTLISSRCSGSGCHMNGGSAAGYNFDADCSIVTNWSLINSSAVTNGNMPKSPQAKLTAAEKLIITNWVNAGHLYTK
jgi:hypothetical protein